MDIKHANTNSTDTVISFQYVRATFVKDMLRHLYTILKSTQAPWYDGKKYT